MAWRRGQAPGQDLRDRVLADAGRPARAVAARFGVSVSYVVKARQRLRDEGDAAPRPQRNRIPPRLAAHEEALRVWVLLHEVPEGPWGAGGQIIRREQLRAAATAQRVAPAAAG